MVTLESLLAAANYIDVRDNRQIVEVIEDEGESVNGRENHDRWERVLDRLDTQISESLIRLEKVAAETESVLLLDRGADVNKANQVVMISSHLQYSQSD